MSINKKLAKIVVTILTIGLLTTQAFAANTTTKNTTTKNTSSSKEADTKVELEKLEIKGFTLEPAFNKDTYQYTVVLEGDDTKLDIVAEANESKANISIIGNDRLINGENIVTILVTNAKETSSATYQIYVNKNLISQEELNKQLQEAETQYQIKQWIIRGLIAFIAICIIILFVLIYKKTNSREYIEQKEQKRNSKNRKKEKFQNPYVEVQEEPKKQKRGNKKSGKHSK